ALRGFFNIYHRRQFLVVDHDQVDGIARGVSIRGHDDSDRLTYEDDVIGREHSIIGHFQIRQRGRARHRPDLGDVFSCVHRDDTGRVRSFADVQAGYARVRIHRAQEGYVQRVRQLDVINV